MTFNIDHPDRRARLEPRAKPYFVRIADGLHLGYRKGKSVSRWVIRTNIDGHYRMRTIARVEPDDRRPADGVVVLNFQQAKEHIMTEAGSKLRCSFCSKSADEVKKLVAGPGVFICDACVALCQLYLDHPAVDSKLLIEDGKAVMKDGAPVFVPLSEDEIKQRDEYLEK